MKLTQDVLANDILKVTLEGDLDIMGSSQLDLPFKALPDQTKKLIVDLTEVPFLASIGIRVLVKTAKAISDEGGYMAVFGAQEAPSKVLTSTGVGRIIALCVDEADAIAKVDR